MTLPDDEVFSLLQNDFVLGWQNIERDEHCGSSRGYSRIQTAVGTTNGAGAHNVQILVLSQDQVVLHALPGFWHPGDLAAELRFAKRIDRLWRDTERSLGQKVAMFRRLHDAEIRRQSPETTARSDWQSFDRFAESRRLKNGDRDTVQHGPDGQPVVDASGLPVMKPLNVVVHERMRQRPFVPLPVFDVAAFVDYGRKYYDNNAGVDRAGRRFRVLEKLMAKRERQAQKSRRIARR